MIRKQNKSLNRILQETAVATLIGAPILTLINSTLTDATFYERCNDGMILSYALGIAIGWGGVGLYKKYKQN
ncbi:MAG: hypothetical protein ABIF40_04785 [archaeon]